MNELIVIPKETALEVFTQTNGLDSYIRQIEDEVNSFVPDTSTAKSRAAIASIAAKIAKSKTYLDGVGKELVDKLKEQPKLVDAERKRMRDKLDALKDQVRKPLTDWENAEESRITEIKSVLEMMKQIPSTEFGSVAIATHLKRLKSTVIAKERFMEFTEDAGVIKDEYVERCERLLAVEKERAAKELEYQREQQKLRDEALKEAETKRIESLPADIKSVLADEEKQAKEIVAKSNITQITKQELTGFEKWWFEAGLDMSIGHDQAFSKQIAQAAWNYAASLKKDSAA